MGLFYRRPLALCAFAFILAAAAGFYLDSNIKLPLIFVAIFIGIVLFVLALICKRHMFKMLTLAICFLAISCAFLHSFLLISRPKENASGFSGESAVLCYVIDKKQISDTSVEYVVNVKNIDGESTNIKGRLICAFESDVMPGDEIYGAGVIESRKNISSNGILVNVFMSDISKCYARYSSNGKNMLELLFSESGPEIVANKMTDSISSVLISLLGEENGVLALGFFTGERSELPAYIARDFRRSGLSHIMAVSGSHIAILLGSIEILLRKLFVPKGTRCAVISLCGLLFIFITGFSLSGIRSVLMLYAVYLSYLFYEDNDSVTSLFVSVFLIMLVFPFSVVDIGLWMSFLATLGLLTIYPVIEERIPYPKKKNKIINFLLLLLRQILTAAIITLVANMLLLPIIWYYFGELSWVSVISNIVIAPLASIFLIMIPILLFTFKIPLIGTIVTYTVSFVAEVILYLVGFFSKIPNATLSLKYQICSVIVIVFAAATVVLLLVKFKHKIWIVAPYACAIVLLIGASIYMGKFGISSYLKYDRLYGGEELFIITEGSELSVCDNSEGSLFATSGILYDMEDTYATEIYNYVFTHYHNGHIYYLDVVTQNAILRNLYLPIPLDSEEKQIAESLWNMAKNRGIKVIFYENGEELMMTDNSAMKTVRSEKHERGRTIAFYGEKGSVVYATPAFCDENISYDRLLIGGHGVSGELVYNIDGINANAIYVTSKEINKMLTFKENKNIFKPADWSRGYEATFALDE